MLSVTPEILIDLPWGQLLVNGLALGSLYALTAFGIVLIFKTTQVITFAQGETAMFSTFVAFTLLTAFQLPFAVAFVLTMLFAGVFGALIERVIIRRISTTTVLNPVIVTVGLSLILLGAAGWIWGYEIRTFPDPVVGPPLHLGSVDSPASQAPSSADCCSASSTASSGSQCLSFATPLHSPSSCSCSWCGPVACWAGTRPRRSRRAE